MANAVQLSNISPTLLPPTITGPIFQKASETSAVMSLARRVPLAVNAATAIPVPMDVPTADWISEGGSKPTGSTGMGVKVMTGKKVALLVPLSQEVVMTNSAGLYSQLQQDLPTAIGRAFDYAAIHGKNLKTGAAGPFGDFLAQTPNSVVIGTADPVAGGAYTDLWTGVSKVVNGPVQGYEFSGFAADPRLRPELAVSVDANGRPFFVDNSLSVNNGGNTSSLIGYPVAFNTGVSGKYYRQGDAVQVVTETGTPTGGTFTLTIGGATTGSIAQAATAATVQTAVQGLGGAVASGVTVAGSAGGPYTLTFSNGSAPVTAKSSLTGGTSPGITVAQSPDADSGLRAVGGDWSQAAFGIGMDISIKISNEASYVDAASVTHSAFQENLVLLLVEAYFGFIVNDVNAFVAYTAS